MLSQYFQSLESAGAVGVAMLLVSVALFVVVLIRTLRLDGAHIARMQRLPLETDAGNGSRKGGGR